MREWLIRYLKESEKKTKAEALMWLMLHVQNQPFLILDEALAQEWGWTVEEVKSFLSECRHHHAFDFDGTGKGWLVIQPFDYRNEFVSQTLPKDSTNGAANGFKKDERHLPREEVRRMLDAEMASKEERRMLYELEQIENYPLQYKKDLQFLRKLMVEYPEVEMLEEIKKFAAHKLDKPLKKKSNPRLALRNWIKIASERKRQHENDGRYSQESPRNEKIPSKFERLRKQRMGV